MKKVMLTTILFISSFFLFNLKNVYASEYSYQIKESYIALIDDNFMNLRNEVIEVANNRKYFILTSPSNSISIYISTCDTNPISCPASVPVSYTFKDSPRFRLVNYDVYLYVDSELVFSTTYTTDTYIDIFSPSNGLYLLDSNVVRSNTSVHSYTFNYNDKSYVFTDNLPTIYSIYLDNLEPEDPYIEEKNVLLSFYNYIFDKLSYLATLFATNYIFLTTLGIFILIFIVELVRRLLK